jgi:hypothetical protein
MATLDEITKEKQRIGEALARVDAQREKLAGELSELEAAERVLARCGTGPRARTTASAHTSTAATNQPASARSGRRQRTPAARPAGGQRTSPSLNDQVLALATGKTQARPRDRWRPCAVPCRVPWQPRRAFQIAAKSHAAGVTGPSQ